MLLADRLEPTFDARPAPPAGVGVGIASRPPTVASELARALLAMGAQASYGVVGGGVAPVAEALQREGMRVFHFRHEGGAAFAATEASLASGRPTVVFVTLGPGLTNAITGIVAARSEGARLVVVSGLTPAASRGRFALQETAPQALPSDLFTAGSLFDMADVVESAQQLPACLARIAHGLRGAGGFVAHLAMAAPTAAATVEPLRCPPPSATCVPVAPSDAVDAVASRIATRPFFIWVGFGARHAAAPLRELVELTGATVVATPRGKGIFPEDHEAYAGVTGLGGHERVRRVLGDLRPAHALVLGSRLGELSSFWRDDLAPSEELVHVDVDRAVFGRAYPHVPTFGVQAEIGDFLRRLVARLRAENDLVRRRHLPRAGGAVATMPRPGRIRSAFLFEQIQRHVVDGSDAVVLAEPGGAFAWGTRQLAFREPGRWRTTMAWASMGHTAAGVVGAALATGKKAVSLVGDGALLMNNEVHTAVRYRAPAAWIVLNNGEYGMVRHGMTAQRMCPVETELGHVDFAAIAAAVGATGERVEREEDLGAAVVRALQAKTPHVLDVLVDADEVAPYMDRVESLIEQGVVGATAPRRTMAAPTTR